MPSQTRKPWVGGNWKCNGTVASITALSDALNKVAFDTKAVDVVICPSPIHMTTARSLLNDKFIIASQNVSKTGNGAYTGETSTDMLQDAGFTWTLIGHSERRQYYGESDAEVAAKVEVCQKNGMYTAICIGEHLDQRKNGEMNRILTTQIQAFLAKVTDWSRVVIAYEPVWAIGTGVVATPDQAQEAHAFIRSLLKEKAGDAVAQSVRIVYGGSVNEKNCKGLFELDDIDGFLVGGASLKPEFGDIIKCTGA